MTSSLCCFLTFLPDDLLRVKTFTQFCIFLSALPTPELLECNPHSNPLQFLECNPPVTPTIFLECNPHSTPHSNPKFCFGKKLCQKQKYNDNIRDPNLHCNNKYGDEFILQRWEVVLIVMNAVVHC